MRKQEKIVRAQKLFSLIGERNGKDMQGGAIQNLGTTARKRKRGGFYFSRGSLCCLSGLNCGESVMVLRGPGDVIDETGRRGREEEVGMERMLDRRVQPVEVLD